jgi:hypothetical protein
MRPSFTLSTGLFITSVLLCAVFYLPAQEQKDQEKSDGEIQLRGIQAKGMPPRAAPTEYQAQAKAGTVTIAAEFMGHAIPTPEQPLTAEDYVVVEAGIFGPPDARTTLSRNDFSLRINGKKNVLSSEPYELVFHSLKDPEWQPPESADAKASKSSISTGGGGADGAPGSAPPPPPKMPFPLRRAMEQHVQKAAMQEGDRPLPQAGLLFFLYRGKTDGIKAIELVYSGAAGKATLTLQP